MENHRDQPQHIPYPSFGGGTDPAWVPTAQDTERSRLLTAMRRWGIDSLEHLHRISIEEPERYWRLAVEDLGVEFGTSFTAVRDDSEGIELPRWFIDGRLNAATLCSHRHAASDRAGRTAVVYEGDSGQRRTMTFAELDVQVRRFAANLTSMGVRPGDRVLMYMPVVPEAVVTFLGSAMIGAIAVPTFTGFGASAIRARIEDAEPTVVVTADGTTRRGQPVPLKPVVDEALEGTEGTPTVIVIQHTGDDVPMCEGRDVYWHELATSPQPVSTAQLDSNHPLTIIYTSGTTGRPKGIVHSHGGFAVKAASDFAYGFDVHADEVVAWICDMGWLVGPLMIMGPLQLGASIVLTEGVPTHPSPTRMWEIIDRNGVTVQGIAPTAARAIRAAGDDVPDMRSLRAFVSTGEAWDEPTWWWLFQNVGGGRRPIMNYSGGTEVGGGIINGYPFLPIAPGGFNGPLPGLDVRVLNDRGDPVIGEIGELSVLGTWPGMTHAFWNDKERYLHTYWSRFEGVWVHGDLASVGEHGGWQIHGRSDDTINVSGRRVGPAEIEAALLKDQRIIEAAAIGVPDPVRGQSVVAFVVLADGDVEVDDVRATAVANVGRSFAPEVVVVQGLPKTKNGKIMRRAIRAQHLGSPAGDMSSLDLATPLESIPTRAE